MLLAPDHNLVSWLWVVTWEEPEEELSCLIFLTGDGKKTRVTLADIPCNVRKGATIDGKGWVNVSQESAETRVQSVRVVA